MLHTLPNLSPLEVEFRVEYQTKVGIASWIRIQIGIPCWIINLLGECKIAKIRYLWTFWPVIQLKDQKCSDIFEVASVSGGEIANLKACHFSHFNWITGQNVQRLQIFTIFAS